MANISDLYNHVNELIKQDIDSMLVAMIEYGSPTVPMQEIYIVVLNDDSGGAVEGATVTVDNEYVGTTRSHDEIDDIIGYMGQFNYLVLEVPVKDSYHINVVADGFSETDGETGDDDIYMESNRIFTVTLYPQ